MKEMTKKISICLCTYNGEKYLKKQLLSIFNQTKSEYIGEIIICDDLSTDNSLKIIEEFLNKTINLRIIQNTYRLGVQKNFEKCLKMSIYPIIIFCDQDDIWKKNKIQKILNINSINENKPVAVVHNASIINYKEEIIIKDFMSLRGGFSSSLVKNFYKNRYLGCCLTINSSLKEEIIPFPKFIPMHDIWVGIVVSLTGKTFFINEDLTLYRSHTSNASNASINRTNFFKDTLKYKLLFIFCVFFLIFRKIYRSTN